MRPQFATAMFLAFVFGCGDAAPAPLRTAIETPMETRPSTTASEPAQPTAEEPASVTLRVASWNDAQALAAEQRGKIVVVDIWSTTCAPCRRDFPQLVALQRKFGGRGVVCVSFNCDYDGIPEKPPEYYRERVERFLTGQQATLINLLSSDPLDVLLEGPIAGMPSVVVYNRDGEIAKVFHNTNLAAGEEEFGYDEIRRLVENLLESRTGEGGL